MSTKLTPSGNFILCRSDKGDGGWSLHEPESTDEDIANGDAPPLISGPANRINHGWDRPDVEDFLTAARRSKAQAAARTREQS